MLNKWLNRWKRCSGNEKPLKLIKEWYSSCKYVDSWRGVHLHLAGRGSISLPCTTMGVWLSLYVRGLTLIRHDYFGRKLRSHESLWYHLPRNIRKLKQRRPRATRTAKKTIDLFSKTITLHVQHTFLYISLPSLHDYDVVKMLNFTFYVGSENKTTIFFFLLWT